MKAEYKEKIKELNEELLKLDVLKRESYMVWKKSIISQNDYFIFVENYSKSINEMKELKKK